MKENIASTLFKSVKKENAFIECKNNEFKKINCEKNIKYENAAARSINEVVILVHR